MKATVPIYILAGGKSTRFGSDKARAMVEGRPLVLRLAEALAPLSKSVTVVADVAGKYADLELRTIGDLNPGGGPMAGLQTALHDCGEPWLLLLSCDLVRVRPAWVERLLRARTEEANIVAFRHSHWEPLLALYHQRVRQQVDAHLADGRRRMQALLEVCAAIAVELPADWPAISQANTPADLEAALQASTGEPVQERQDDH